MPAIPDPLTATDCPLLARFPDTLGPVLAEFNRAVGHARTLQSKYRPFLDQPDVSDALLALAEARRRLTTPRFKVGFLGPFQCGKSTTLNNLLGTEIAGTGAGKATTSVITRLTATKPGTPPALSLRYFSVDEYLTRRNTLAEWARLPNPHGLSEPQLLDKLRAHNPNKAGVSAQRRVLDDDVPYLRAFLQSYEDARAKNLIRTDPLTAPAVYADKDRLLTHSHGDDGRTKPSQYLLLAESAIAFGTDRIDPELELVDCPGLGSGRSVDDLLTKEYIPRLDGALVFLRAESMYSAEVLEILNDLKAAFRDNLKARVWVVVNKMDAPDRKAKLVGDTQGKTTFDLIGELESLHGIPLSQVCLGCNKIHRLATEAGGVADRGRALAALDVEAADEPTLLKKLAPTPPLKAAFEEMLKDGSIGLLRRLIKERIAPSVADEIVKQAGADAARAAADLEYAVRQAEKPASEQERKDALVWENALFLLLADLGSGRTDGSGARGDLFTTIETLGRAAKTNLERKFLANAPDEVLAIMSAADLVSRFDIDAGMMQAEVDGELERVAQAVYTEVTGRIEGKALPAAVPLPGGRDPLALWHEFRQQDRDANGWRDKLRPVLHDRGLIDRLAAGNYEATFTGPKYKRLMLEKLRTAAHQIALAVRGRVRYRLDDLRKQVSKKLGPPKATA